MRASFSDIKRYIIGDEIGFKKPTLDMVKTSIFCAPRGFIVFFLAAASSIDSAILKDEKRKREGLYAMWHNIAPFLEASVLMPIIMTVMHLKVGALSNLSTKTINIITPFICLAAAFSICMTLRMLGIRQDCCDDINYMKGAIPQKPSFKVPPCSGRRKSIPKCFYEPSEENYQNVERNKVHSILYKIVCALFILPLLAIRVLDSIVGSVINFITCPVRRFKCFCWPSEENKVHSILYAPFVLPLLAIQVLDLIVGSIINFITCPVRRFCVYDDPSNTIRIESCEKSKQQ